MKTETKQCKNCKKEFTIESEDFNFYEKIKVPPPTWCPECRQQRRYAWRNERNLYRRNCDLCGKSTVTIYSPNKPVKVYCLKCWWGDSWDSSEYGRDFDFSRLFFEQYKEMQKEVPRMALFSKNSINSDYTNQSSNNKNVYLSFTCRDNEDIFYSTWVMKSRGCVDCSFIWDKGEWLYEMIDSRKSYHCQFGVLLENCVDCFYCYDLHNCNNCFLSYNLRNKNYVFKNEQYSRDTYLEKIKEYNLSSYKTREKLYKEFFDLMANNSIHRYVISKRNTNSTGSTLFNSKNSKFCFDSEILEDTKYMVASLKIKTAMDIYHVGFNSELVYECHGCGVLYNSHFCHLCYDDNNITYCDTCQNSENLFGCISVKKGEYMILNKKYTKGEYFILKEKIIEHMKKTGEYGEFFPSKISPVYYNETQGNYYMPLTKKEVFDRGWQWEEKTLGVFGKENIKLEEIPDTIEEVKDDVFEKVFKCIECIKNYNITSYEFSFYQKEKIPLPRFCPECRYVKRFNIRLPRKLWTRTCTCENVNHNHKDKCEIEFETPYAPDRPEKVYCESCYNKEIY